MSISTKVLLVSLIFLNSSLSEAKQTDKEDKTVSVKCHVQLLGGMEQIYFRVLPEKQLANLPMTLVGHKMATSSVKKKVKINKVYECVLLDDDFTLSDSKLMDEQTAR